ncbi:glycosyltransferase family 4 protein [Thauera aminoaromatica]|uniref:Group 1 glycosyl transferase n=1 Tax=Thauera aminoaromatica S2 TaxID=1234381 RepID=N6YSP3_THASP|nr:glycosyltransferase family 4 protein [Thauera aminoaromatica]ENO85218.1 group 1 glycosyl transferase [Thauera aminoaromatica S2]
MADFCLRKRVAHLTSVHPRYDTRIFVKQCRSLARGGYEVYLVVADALPDETKDGVNIVSVGEPVGRMDRMRRATKRVFQKAIEIDADVYQIHDPELLIVALQLKRAGKVVVFDSHEDVPKQVLAKKYIPMWIRPGVSGVFGAVERWACGRLDGVVCATEFIRNKFSVVNKNVIDINNYPSLDEFSSALARPDDEPRQICYVGAISRVRGIREMVRAMELLPSDIKLALGGKFHEAALREEVESYPGWRSVLELGWLSREQIPPVFSNSFAGLVTLHPIINYVDALPVKMFEYMVAGLPVIASNFPILERIVVDADCGICVDPYDSKAIADAIRYLIENPVRRREMGENGRNAVLQKYNWGFEEAKYYKFYDRLIAATQEK